MTVRTLLHGHEELPRDLFHRIENVYFALRYSILVAPIAPLNLKGAWS